MRIRALCLRTGLLIALLGLGGCGFRPVYAKASGGAAGPAAEGLAEVSVALMPERTGQLLRQALQERFERSGLTPAHRYDLNVSFSIVNTSIAIQPDSSNSRIRFIGTANYQLIAQDPGRTTLTTGTARSVDGMDLYDQQLFGATLETEVVQQRIAEAVADEITRQLAVYFDQHATVADR